MLALHWGALGLCHPLKASRDLGVPGTTFLLFGSERCQTEQVLPHPCVVLGEKRGAGGSDRLRGAALL